MSENAERRAARRRFQVRYRALYDEVVDILYEIDPIGVHVDHNAEKFVPEATSILARLRDARSAEDIQSLSNRSCDAGMANADSPTKTRGDSRGRLRHLLHLERFLDESAR